MSLQATVQVAGLDFRDVDNLHSSRDEIAPQLIRGLRNEILKLAVDELPCLYSSASILSYFLLPTIVY